MCGWWGYAACHDSSSSSDFSHTHTKGSWALPDLYVSVISIVNMIIIIQDLLSPALLLRYSLFNAPPLCLLAAVLHVRRVEPLDVLAHIDHPPRIGTRVCASMRACVITARSQLELELICYSQHSSSAAAAAVAEKVCAFGKRTCRPRPLAALSASKASRRLARQGSFTLTAAS